MIAIIHAILLLFLFLIIARNRSYIVVIVLHHTRYVIKVKLIKELPRGYGFIFEWICLIHHIFTSE